MPRQLCSQCTRPINSCWCHCRHKVNNSIEVGILQHPSELKQVKSSIPLLLSSLQNYRAWVGELIGDAKPLDGVDSSLQAWLNNGKQTYLLYPATEGDAVKMVNACDIETDDERIQLLVLDGTWRKTFKMLQLNSDLQKLPRIRIQPTQASQYWIRKQKGEMSLSTIEAVGQLLTEVEQKPEIQTALQQAFVCFQKAIFTYQNKS